MTGWLGLGLAAFLLGGIPFAYLTVRLVYKTDVREHGSGNVGATNASRLFPPRWRLTAFLVIFLLDAAKGLVAVLVLPPLFSLGESAPAFAGLLAVLGHMFTPFLRLRGGKGVATTLGALTGLEPFATAAALAAFFCVFALTRIVAAGSIALAVVLPVAVFFHGKAPRAVVFLAVALGILIVVRHRSNISGMMRRQT